MSISAHLDPSQYHYDVQSRGSAQHMVSVSTIHASEHKELNLAQVTISGSLIYLEIATNSTKQHQIVTNSNKHMYTYTCMHICIHVYVYMYAYMHTCIHIHVCIYAYMYMYTCVCCYLLLFGAIWCYLLLFPDKLGSRRWLPKPGSIPCAHWHEWWRQRPYAGLSPYSARHNDTRRGPNVRKQTFNRHNP